MGSRHRSPLLSATETGRAKPGERKAGQGGAVDALGAGLLLVGGGSKRGLEALHRLGGATTMKTA